jgi:hypothetical protein
MRVRKDFIGRSPPVSALPAALKQFSIPEGRIPSAHSPGVWEHAAHGRESIIRESIPLFLKDFQRKSKIPSAKGRKKA